MDVPRSASIAGLYVFGAAPGQPGVAVIAGHRSWGRKSALFDNLHSTKVGDIVTISDDSGRSVDFVVQKIQKYKPGEIIPDVFTAYDSTPRLNLITCNGDWDTAAGTATERLVVYTIKK